MLIKSIGEKDARARENRRFTVGQVVTVFTLSHTCRVDVGVVDRTTGAPVYLEGVPYTPTSPPAVGDKVPLEYSGTSNHSVRIGIGRVGGQSPANSQQVSAANIVSDVRVSGELSGQAGSIILAAGASVVLGRVSKTFTLSLDGYDLKFSREAAPAGSQVLLREVVARAMTLPVGLTGSYGKSGIAATAQTDIDLQVNGVSKGTARWAIAGTVASFIFASAVSLAAGDVVTAVAPGVADLTLAQICVTLRGRL